MEPRRDEEAPVPSVLRMKQQAHGIQQQTSAAHFGFRLFLMPQSLSFSLHTPGQLHRDDATLCHHTGTTSHNLTDTAHVVKYTRALAP